MMKTVGTRSRPGGIFPGYLALAIALAGFAVTLSGVQAQVVIKPEPLLPPPVDPVADPAGLRGEARLHQLDSLKNVPIPLPSNLSDFVTDRNAVIALGKALFWDEQAGSDGMSCASCHFHAGADSRTKNQISPGIIGGNGRFDPLASGRGASGPNATLRRNDFPFHQKVDPTKSELGANVKFDSDDVASSGGVLHVEFRGLGTQQIRPRLFNRPSQDLNIIRQQVAAGIRPSSDLKESFFFGGFGSRPGSLPSVPEILVVTEVDPLGFSISADVKRLNTRRVEPRNTPTVINAIFNYRNFWDGRANFNFNGRSPFGPRDKSATVLEWNGAALNETPISLDFASLASQAVGPAESVMEMSAVNRHFLLIGRKLLQSTPLALQQVAANDSVLGPISNASQGGPRRGLKVSYTDLIKQSFDQRWWNAPSTVVVDGLNYSHLEANFSMFWGIAIMMYESTLVSDQTPFDRFMEGDNTALNAQERIGLSLFLNEGKCANCHHGAEFSGATVSQMLTSSSSTPFKLVERMVMGDNTPAVYDNGFYNINVRPVGNDVGVGGSDPFGNPLSFSVQATTGRVVDKVSSFADPQEFQVNPGVPIENGERVSVMGAFKTPTLRNIDLTGPYFHNGGQLTLEQVVQFYARGTDFASANRRDGFVFDPDVDGDRKINGNRENIRAVAAFLRTLTDPRVARERAPFDRPSLRIPTGHLGSTGSVIEDPRLPGTAVSGFTELPAVGAGGNSVPLQPILGGSQLDATGVPQNDGLPWSGSLAPGVKP
jgi:cytochrome c peroxidase